MKPQGQTLSRMLNGTDRPIASKLSKWPDNYYDDDIPRRDGDGDFDNDTNPTKAKLTGSMTMRRMSEPLQRPILDEHPVTDGIQGGGDAVLEELERQAAEMEQMRRLAEHGDAPQDAADDVDYHVLRSMLETDPHKVIRALVEFLRQRKGS